MLEKLIGNLDFALKKLSLIEEEVILLATMYPDNPLIESLHDKVLEVYSIVKKVLDNLNQKGENYENIQES